VWIMNGSSGGNFENGNESSDAINCNDFNRELAIFCFSNAVLHGVNCSVYCSTD
jgi:hypothetical protein